MAFTGLKSGCRQRCVPSGCGKGEPVSLDFTCIPWLVLLSPSSELAVEHLQIHLTLTLLLSLQRTLRMILGPPGSSRKTSLSQGPSLNHILKSLLSCKATYSQIPGGEHRHLWGGYYSIYHNPCIWHFGLKIGVFLHFVLLNLYN